MWKGAGVASSSELPSGLLHWASSSVVSVWEGVLQMRTCSAAVKHATTIKSTKETSQPRKCTQCLTQDAKFQIHAIFTRVAGKLSYSLAHGTSDVEDELVARTAPSHSPRELLRKPCSPESIPWAVVSWRPFMRFSRVKQHVLDEFMGTSMPRRLSPAKHLASQQALIFRENTARWWGRTHSIGCCRLSDAVWDGSVG
jgi:hypothetical protein